MEDLVQRLGGRLLFAVPKKGRLQQSALDLLSGSDIQFRREHRLDIALVKNLDIALVFLPAADIPTFVGEGRVDLGITGRDQVAEYEAQREEHKASTVGGWSPDASTVREAVMTEHHPFTDHSYLDISSVQEEATNVKKDAFGVEEVLDLGFGNCKLQVQVPENSNIKHARDLVGARVATSFMGLTKRFFGDLEQPDDGSAQGAEPKPLHKKLKTSIRNLGGSVETACTLGVADGIVDLVESGETMRAAGLKPIATVIDSTAVLIRSKHPSNQKLIDLIASRIRGVLNAQKYVLCQYNIPRVKLDQAHRITPGKRAPTVTALDQSDWVAISSMVLKKEVAPVMDQLTGAGATDILVLGIANSRTD